MLIGADDRRGQLSFFGRRLSSDSTIAWHFKLSGGTQGTIHGRKQSKTKEQNNIIRIKAQTTSPPCPQTDGPYNTREHFHHLVCLTTEHCSHPLRVTTPAHRLSLR